MYKRRAFDWRRLGSLAGAALLSTSEPAITVWDTSFPPGCFWTNGVLGFNTYHPFFWGSFFISHPNDVTMAMDCSPCTGTTKISDPSGSGCDCTGVASIRPKDIYCSDTVQCLCIKELAPCAGMDGTTLESNVCKCGKSACTANTGLYCTTVYGKEEESFCSKEATGSPIH